MIEHHSVTDRGREDYFVPWLCILAVPHIGYPYPGKRKKVYIPPATSQLAPQPQHNMLRTSVRSLSASSRSLANYGFVGLGQMGQHMARHIYSKLDATDKLFVFDNVPQATTAFVENVTQLKPENKDKLIPLHDLAEFGATKQPIDFIVLMVPEGKHVKAVTQALAAGFKAAGNTSHNTTFVDCSTIDIASLAHCAEFIRNDIPTFEFIDSPVSGGVAGARNGTLTFMVSKAEKLDISPGFTTLLEKMGKNIFACGATPGSGLGAKLANNYCLAVTNLAVCDSFQLAKSFGLDPKKYAEIIAVSTGKSWASVDNCPIPGVYPDNQLPSDAGYNGGFVTKLTRKDLVLAIESAELYHRPLYLGETSRYWYDKACEHNDLANKDLSVLYEYLGDIKEDAAGKLVDTHQ